MKTSDLQALRASWGHGLLLLQGIYKPILKRENVSPAQKRILYGLDKHGAMTKQELAKAVVLDPSALTRAMQRLEAIQYIRRDIDVNDKRYIQLELTDKGKKKIASIKKQAFAIFKQACVDINPKDILLLQKSLESINHRLTQLMEEIS